MSKCSLTKRSKINPNIYQVLKSMVFVASSTKRASEAQGLFKVDPSAEP